ncbi:leucine-rich repeat serine/threonine-protein kinase 1 isoform X1 [Myzus persicae]|uniref:leucine-rich repeat serine/threonine-protein kinase 1 isoform X1 n=1 Tax=Myzus persicae TaxID=13164 RepID=UPI000B937AEE|nr:leucine-rich repeat serine/threonine-protein kinase 1 isoform X1 [Myzus persicae]
MAEDEDFPGRLLHQVALWDNVDFLTDLLKDDEHKKFINSRDSWGRTALHAACSNEGSGCLEILLNAGALVDTPCGPRGESRTALHISAHIGCPKNIQTLLNHNANIILQDSNGFTALDIALSAENTVCSKLLKDASDSWEESQSTIHMALREAICRGDISTTKTILSELGSKEEFIVNMAPNGTTTLLYCACEVGKKDLVKLLLDHKADGRIHPITRYSPLYIVAFKGKKDVFELLLKKFPDLIRQTTVEKWLPIHAACINGNIQVLELLLKYPYPPNVLIKLRKDNWEFDVPFDINTKDVNGQTVLYLACLLGNSKIVDILLKYQVKAIKICGADGISAKDDNNDMSKRSRISEGIQSIVSRLRGSMTKEIDLNEKNFRPVEVNVYCNEEAPETALHAAVRNGYKDVVIALLENGADPNLLTLQPTADYKQKDDDVREAGTSPLTLACSKGDTAIVELLLKHGARDDDCKALAAAMITKNQHLITTLLGTKAFADPEHKINKKAMTDNIASQFGGLSSLTYSNIFPSTPVMINWHSQRCKLESIKSQWLIDGALHINPRLKMNPRSKEIVLFAITRLDISNNSLTQVPAIIFQLQSLRYLNLAQNKIEKLPDPKDSHQVTSPTSKKMSKLYKSIYTANVLEELYLQDNRLDKIPEELFRLPSLTTLDLSNNKLHSVPFQMWRAPKLKDLNMAFNLIKELPYAQSEDEARSLREKSVGRIPILDKAYEVKEIDVNDIDESISLVHHNVWNRTIEIMEQIVRVDDTSEVKSNSSQLSSLNLSHNRFSSIPPVLSCLAVNLTRLNISYNCLRTMSYITSYPSSLKQLDLSHNKICVWPSLPQINLEEATPDQENLLCYRLETGQVPKSTVPSKIRTSRRMSLRANILNRVCSHRRHLRLENLRTLMLADNCMNRIQLSTDDDGFSAVSNDSADELDDWETGGTVLGHSKSKLIFPNLSMLDLSNNQLKEIPYNINELINLSVLNISGNKDVTELPPQMGLLSRLWNLNTRGCSLQEPLKSMIDSNKYKTMDVIGYLKSVLEDAKPYARMKLMIVGVQGIGKTSLLDQLRQEGTGSYKKKPVDHWAKRMGNKNINQKTNKGTNISTVGVDIGDWVYEKKIRGNSQYGPVMFRTWDFGGQNEYYATHQYFLSKRSLYIVVWKITDGHRGIAEILQWLVNIQARAPNSPVIIIGTHYDVINTMSPEYHSEQLQQLIRDRFINIVDAEKYGLPRVLDTIEVSCKTKHNIKLLCNIIYDTVFSLRPPGSKELLLEQRVPATYLALEDIVSHIGSERRQAGMDPVLNLDQFRTAVNAEMLCRYQKSFRDMAELNQAILFLHENGVLLHYDDATLKDLYFLDPQWLCDMLAHVVTIREINPFARSGVMKLDDLQIVLKSSTCTREYIVNLLNKFEVALTWDSRSLLIPSLLPSEEDMYAQRAQPVSIKVPMKSKIHKLRTKISSQPLLDLIDIGENITSRSDPEVSVRRLLLMSYFPSGFWSRLITRILGDDTIIHVIRQFFMPSEVNGDDFMCSDFQTHFDWILWQTGIELKFANKITLFRMKEVLHRNFPINYRHLRFQLYQENSWYDVPIKTSSILETYLPLDTVIIKRPIKNKDEEDIGFRAIVLDPSPVQAAKLLALVVDHIDVLLEDWYPTLGTRFVHTSEGKCLVTRLVPCPRCLAGSVEADSISIDIKDDDSTSKIDHISKEFLKRDSDTKNIVRKSQESYNGSDGGDSGFGHDISPQSSRKVSVEGHPLAPGDQVEGGIHYGWIVEDCILAASSVDKLCVICPKHGDLSLAQVAPDTVFLDLGEELVINDQDIIRGKLLGRGAFGFVFKGVCKGKKPGNSIQIAIKMLQPVPPGPNASQSAVIAYKGAQAKWDRDPLQYTCKSYCSARQELNIMLNLKHPNIVPLIGVCTKPLALILDLAPMGALDQILRNYRRSGSKFDPHILQQIVFQTAKALEYLHQQRIIYRDLKSENVLVWSIPVPLQDPYAVNTHVKMADYGISRLSLPSGTKGFGGTEGFMAPEIIKYNGEEEYTEKVDCFSFGMFIYELVTMHQPFENHESVKESILEGHRPALTYRETAYPSYLLDLMAVCWSQSPKERPSASQIVSIVSAPEFTHLYDVVSLSHSADVISCSRIPLPLSEDNENSGDEIWLPCSNGKLDRLAFSITNWFHYRSTNVAHKITAICAVDDHSVWLGDAEGQIHAYSSNDSKYMFSYKLTTDDQEVGVKRIVTLKDRHRVAVGLENGRIFLVRSDMSPLAPTMGEGSFVMSELGSSTILFDFIAVDSNKTCELWCGEDQGRISVYTIKQNVAINYEVLKHFDYTGLESQVMSLSASRGHNLVWSYVHPGCIVYQWDVVTRKIMNKLDCSKLIPCSESLKSISIEERLSPGKCQITCICAVGDELYLGTAWGCIVVVEQDTARPITVFRPYEQEVTCMTAACEGNAIISIGHGYRSLLKRYLSHCNDMADVTGTTFAILWSTRNWNAY